MNEDDWQQCSDVALMLELLRGCVSDRKLQLITIAFHSGYKGIVESDRILAAVRKVEDSVDSSFGFEDSLRSLIERICASDNPGSIRRATQLASLYSAVPSGQFLSEPGIADQNELCEIIRCIVGYPFTRVEAESSWWTAQVVSLVRTIYDERAFEILPILADALMDAGCADERVLGHCRNFTNHFRGCWVIDMLQKKS